MSPSTLPLLLVLGLCALVGTTAGAEAGTGTQMFQDYLASMAPDGASVMSKRDPYYQRSYEAPEQGDGAYYGPPSSKLLELSVASFSNCAARGCWQCSAPSPVAETSMTCADSTELPLLGKSATPVATCSWAFDFFTLPYDGKGLPVPNAAARRVGQFKGQCTLGEAADTCGGADCGGSTVRIDGWLYSTPAWFTSLYAPTLVNDNVQSLCEVDKLVPSCCFLTGTFLYNSNLALLPKQSDTCGDTRCARVSAPRSDGKNSQENPRPWASSPDSLRKAPGGSKTKKANPRPQEAAASVQLSTPPTVTSYYTGSAIVASGSFVVEQTGSEGKKWNSRGSMDWVVGTFPEDASDPQLVPGTPPLTLFYAEAGKLRLKFTTAGD